MSPFQNPVRAVLVSALVGLAGCEVGPTYTRPDVPLPQEYGAEESMSFSADAAALIQWWKGFDDPVLNDLVETSFRNNYDLRLSALRILEARANLGFSEGGLLPEVAVSGSVTTADGSENASITPLQTDNYQFGTDLKWELDFWGRIRRSIESADAQLQATSADFHDLRVLIAAEVANAYIQLRSAEQRMLLTEENILIQAKALSDTRAQFDEGDNTLLDVSQAEAVYADTQALLPSLVRERTLARNTLATLLAVSFIEVEHRVVKQSGLPWMDSRINVGVPLDIIRQRPDIQAAEWNAISAAAEVGVREADRRPSVDLAGSLLFQVIDGVPTKAGGLNGSSANDLFDSNSLAYSLMPSIRLPIFDAERRKNAVRAADARYQAALEQFEQSIITALQDVDNAMTQVETSTAESIFLQQSVSAYIKAYETAAIQYEEGDIGFVSVLDSLRQRVSQELNLVRAQSNVSLGVVALYKALGGGWQNIDAPMLDEATLQQMQDRTHWGDLIGEQN